MKLYLIRHAESANNAALANSGDEGDRVPDPEITEKGHQQAQLLAQHLARSSGETQRHPHSAADSLSFGFTHLYCSLMTRSILTAQYIAEGCGLAVVAHPDIFERGGIYEQSDHGTKTGLPGPGPGYFRERFPQLQLPDTLVDEGWYNRPFETEAVFLVRMKAVVNDIKHRHAYTEDCVAMVVHGDFIDQFVNEVTGLVRRPENYQSRWVANWAFHNTSITRIDLIADAQVVVYTNRLSHIPPALASW